jgi:hypothetical protein
LINEKTSDIIALITYEAVMNGMSERDYSNHSGMSRGAVQNAKRSGRLVFYADGSINAVASDARRVEMTDPDQRRRSLGGDAAMPISGSSGSDSYLKARTALTVYQAQERQLAIQKKKGALVDRARAEALVFRLARQEGAATAAIDANGKATHLCVKDLVIPALRRLGIAYDHFRQFLSVHHPQTSLLPLS